MLMNETKEKIAMKNSDMKQKKFLQDQQDDLWYRKVGDILWLID